ncbi:MAG: hypothetical protein O3C21_03455 [Verrucomicrobia bacterium]|nr:hypothetical protein [Verrucomicrobiota bacterium]
MSNTRRPAYGQGGDFRRRTRDSGLFWWTVLITFLMVMTVGSWIFSLYLFAFPEKSFNYHLLSKLEKLKPIEDFTNDTVPTGRFNDGRELYQKFYHFSGEQLEGANDKLKRSYLWNYDDQPPIYVEGTFRIAEVRRLTEDDYFTSGVLVQAYTIEDVEDGLTFSGSGTTKRVFPNAIFEFVFPSGEVPDILFSVGQEISVDSSKDYAALLNIKRVDRDHLCFTAVPLLYGTYQINETASISLAPPQVLKVDAPWPISKKMIPGKTSEATAAGRAPAPAAPEAGKGDA